MSSSQSTATSTVEVSEITSVCGTVMSLDARQNMVHLNDHHLRLKPTPFHLLALLVRYGEQVVNRQTILNEVWGYDFDPGTKIIDVQICYLRKSLEALHAPFEIKTHRGKGFCLRPRDSSSVGYSSRRLNWPLPTSFMMREDKIRRMESMQEAKPGPLQVTSAGIRG